jgi:hypothetical protein
MEVIIMSQFTVITGDVIKSRKYKNVNEILNKNLKKISYPESIIAPFKISRGDEIQTIFEELISFPKFLRQVRYKLQPLDVRFGIGFGKINEKGNKINSWNMNGAAFYNARESLENIENNNEFKTKFNSGHSIDEAINTILYLIDTFQSDWTDSQWEAIYYYEEKGTYKKAAKELDIAFQNVEKRCRAANWKEVNFAEISIENLIKKFYN